MIHEDIKHSTTLLRHPNPVHTQCYADNSMMSCDAVHEAGHKFGQCLSCGGSHFFNSCKSRNSKCFKCGDIGHIQSVCNVTAHLTASNIKSCNSDSIKWSIYNDHLALSTISKDSVDSYSSSELNETQNSCETIVSNQSTYQISHVIVPDMVFPKDSFISDEISSKSEENMLNETSHDRKPDVVLIDGDFLMILYSAMTFLINSRKLIQKSQILMSYQILLVLILHLFLVGDWFNAKHEY
ncbi:unnamed protein product [Schistosoma curassoni]|uniref:CCHC-type domain-containing protein n=1 Tax=Schistosoma curassoni TaxID=6186 RepID=A0A183JV31_9TREM|nr:unnamed protein product [Schistosoma curassoni]